MVSVQRVEPRDDDATERVEHAVREPAGGHSRTLAARSPVPPHARQSARS
jgi:hypothetical protein